MFRILLVLILFTACSNTTERSPVIAVREVMEQQQIAWNRGDIPGFMEGYSDTICFISKRGRTCGKVAVTANYLKSYPDRATMGRLAFDIHEVLIANDRAWVTGNWDLQRINDTVGGGFSLLWVNEDGSWRIVRDHTY